MSTKAYETYLKIGSDTIQVRNPGVADYTVTERIEYFTHAALGLVDTNVIVLYRAKHLVTQATATLSAVYSQIYDSSGTPLGGTPQAVLNAITVILETASGGLNGAATAANQATQIGLETTIRDNQTNGNQVIQLPADAATETKQDLQLVQETSIANSMASLYVSWENYTRLFYNTGGAGPAVDAFNNMRVSEKQTLLDLNHRYNKQPLLEDELTANGGTATHLPNESSVHMAVTAAAGSRVVRQTYEYFKYQAGKSQLILMTGVMCESLADVGIRSRMGYFDDAADKSIGTIDGNGIYFERNELGELAFVLRSYISGVQVNTRITQANWNYDKFDGTGVSGVTLDVSKSQILLMDLEWLGVGTIRFGFVINGQVKYAHYLDNANIINSVYMTTASLPVRYEITNVTGAQTGSMKQICSSVNSEAGFNPNGLIYAASMGVTAKTVSSAAALPLISLRLAAAYNRATINPLDLSTLTSTSGNVLFRVVLNGSLTGAAFAATNPYMFGEVDTTASAIAGGVTLRSIYVSDNTNSIVTAFENVKKLSTSIAGVSDILTVTAQKIGAGTEDVLASLQWQEYV